MEVKLAKSAGFCWGVKRAIDMALELRSRSNAPIHTLGPLIHNPQTLAMLQNKEIHEVNAVDEAEAAVNVQSRAVNAQGEPDGYVVVRAHGISPEVRERLRQSNLKMVDATCPDVGVIAGNIRKYLKRGHDIIVLGDPEHAEVIGLMGYTEGRGYAVESLEDIAALPHLARPYVVSQSTLDGETWLALTEGIKERFSETTVKNTICDATTDRQSEVMQLAKEVDVMIVVGGQASSNTKKLVKVALRCGVKAHQVETEADIDPEWFKNCRVVGVTAGASTPNWLIMKVVEHIERIETTSDGVIGRMVTQVAEFLLQNHVLLALGASALTYVAAMMMGLTRGTERFWAMALAGLFVYSMHSFHTRAELGTFKIQDVFNLKTYPKLRWLVFRRSGAAFFLGLAIAWHLGWEFALFYTFVSAVGFTYRLEWIPCERFKFLKYRSLLAIPGSRDIFVSMAWATMVVGLPALCLRRVHDLNVFEAIERINLPVLSAFVFVAAMVFVRSLVSDERDIKRDKLIGRETLPIVLGERETIRLHWGVLLALAAVLIFLGLRPKGHALALVLLPTIAVTYFYVHLYHYHVKYRNILLDLLADAKFLAIGAWTFAWLHWIR